MEASVQLVYDFNNEQKSETIEGHYFINNLNVQKYNSIGIPDSDRANINIILPSYYNEIEPVKSNMYAYINTLKVKILDTTPVRGFDLSVTKLIGIIVNYG